MMIKEKTSDAPYETYGFPPGYFVLYSDAAGERVLDVYGSKTANNSSVGLWPEKDGSLVEARRSAEADNQVFFIDDTGALCSRSSGHAIDVTEGRNQLEGALVLRHRKPASQTVGRRLPRFTMDQSTGEIIVQFFPDSSPKAHSSSRQYVLASIPQAKSRTIMDDASELLTSAVTAPFHLFSGTSKTNATPEAVYGTDIDIGEDEVLPEERGVEAEVDDSPELGRQVCVISVRRQDDRDLLEATKLRRRWRALPLRMSNARTGAI